MKMRFRIISILLLFAGTPLFAQHPAKEAVFTGGEKLTFVVSYYAKLVPNSELAEVVFRTTSTNLDGVPVYKIHANARVLPQYRWFYNLDDTYETWLEKSTLLPLKFSNELNEGKYRFKSSFIYDWNNMLVHTTSRNFKHDEEKVRTMHLLSKRSMDGLALFYNLRCEDISSFVVGENRVLELVLDDTIRKVNYRYLGKEEKNLRGAGRFKTLKFSCQLTTAKGESFEEGSEFFLWISDDRNRIPLYIESPIRVGSVRATIRKWEGLKHDLESKIK